MKKQLLRFVKQVCLVVVWLASTVVLANAQQINLKGRVIDSLSGLPLANVVIGTTAKTLAATNQQGEFSVRLSGSVGKLYFSLIGYQKKEITMNEIDSAPIIALTPQITTLAEVQVATGYQRISKEQSTGSFIAISEAKLNEQVGTNILSRLDGVANSVRFDSNSQRPSITIKVNA